MCEMIPRGGVGVRKSVYGVCFLAALVVLDTGTVGGAGLCSCGPGVAAFNAALINCGVVWAKTASFL